MDNPRPSVTVDAKPLTGHGPAAAPATPRLTWRPHPDAAPVEIVNETAARVLHKLMRFIQETHDDVVTDVFTAIDEVVFDGYVFETDQPEQSASVRDGGPHRCQDPDRALE